MESYEHAGGSIGNDDGFFKELEDDTDKDHPGEIPDGADADEVRTWITTYFKYRAKLKKESRNRVLVMMFIKKVDQSKYGDLCASLYNNIY